MKKYCLLLTTLYTLGVLLGACTLPSATSTATLPPAPTDTVALSPTASETPTHTTPPTRTPFPTRTPTATPVSVSWNHVGLPTGAQRTSFIFVHPENENQWIVVGQPGESASKLAIYTTNDSGQTWQTVYSGSLIGNIMLDPSNGDTLYATDYGKLIRSMNRGQTWEMIHDFNDSIGSMHISTIDGAIYVLPRFYSSANPGVYRSDDNGQTWNFYPYGANILNFIPWDIEEDPNTGMLYVVIEIADHPRPYDPPFYRSPDRGETWEEIGDDLPWHGLSIQVDPLTSDVYFLSEGSGLYKSTDMGSHWTRISPKMDFTCGLILDPASPPRLIGSEYYYQPLFDGGVYYSDDGGENFIFLGLEGYTTCELTLNASSTRLYVVAYEQGIYTAEIPAPQEP